jgi:Flp pilus assembly protein TadG
MWRVSKELLRYGSFFLQITKTSECIIPIEIIYSSRSEKVNPMIRSNINNKNMQLRAHREHGQALVIIALGLVVLMAAIGLATDASLLYKAKQDLQRTVDSAALAAAYKLPNTTDARNAANEFASLHSYDLSKYPLTITYPVYVPPRKAVSVVGKMDVNFAFLSIIGIRTMTVSATGEAEAAPMDVFLIFDLSESMVYDTTRPFPFPPSGFTACNTWDSSGYSDCIAKYCNWAKKCDPLDIHIKPAAKYFLSKLDPTYDRVGVVAYDQSGTIIIPLSNDFTAVTAAIDSLQAFDHQGSSNCDITRSPSYPDKACNKQTNIGDGIMMAHNSIAADGRLNAIWSMILMTDGKANIYRQTATCNTCPPNCGISCQYVHLCDECPNANAWAIINAKDTWKRNETVIYTIAYGTNSPGFETLMINIADCTDSGKPDELKCPQCPANGICTGVGTTDNFWATPDEASLRIAFAEIASRIYSRLLK